MEIKAKKIGTRNAVALKMVSEAIGVPAEVIKWNLEKYSEAEGMKDSYVVESKGYIYLYPECVLWVMKKTDSGEFKAVADILEIIALSDIRKEQEAQEDDAKKAADALAGAMTQLSEIKEALELSCDTVAAMMDSISGNAKKTGAAKKGAPKENDPWRYFKRNDPNLPDLTKEQKDWQAEMEAIIKKKQESTGVQGPQIYRLIYRIMNSKYGIVFEQEKKEFLERENLPKETVITTYRLVTYSDNMRSLMKSIACDLEKYV